jgi:hypothetical protein
MQLWEYSVWVVYGSSTLGNLSLAPLTSDGSIGQDGLIATVLERLGEQGWELVGIDNGSEYDSCYIFKRLKPEPERPGEQSAANVLRPGLTQLWILDWLHCLVRLGR